jgi:uncharacterized membrane protein (Fun14 family)
MAGVRLRSITVFHFWTNLAIVPVHIVGFQNALSFLFLLSSRFFLSTSTLSIMTDKIPDQVSEFIKANAPVANQLGFGGIMGYCSGMAFRRVGRVFGVVLGIGFMGAQAAAASGYIEIDWDKVKNDAIKPFDTVSISL